MSYKFDYIRCGKSLENGDRYAPACGGECVLPIKHEGPCCCGGDRIGTDGKPIPDSCPA